MPKFDMLKNPKFLFLVIYNRCLFSLSAHNKPRSNGFFHANEADWAK